MGTKITRILFMLAFMLTSFGVETFSYPSNSMVSVCIMDEKYTTTEKTSVNVYSTGNSIIKTPEGEYSLTKDDYAAISRSGNVFSLEIYRNDGKKELYETDKDFNMISIDGVLGIKDFIRGGKPAMYRGEFKFIAVPNKSDKFYLINKLDVEYYLKGVVPCEMPVAFGLEALKAQAVAARNYSTASRTRMNRFYDVVDSVASQVYHGYNRESSIANKAIDQTHGIVALYDDDMIIAVFSSTAGGYTEDYSNTFSDPKTGEFPSKPKPYLIAKPDLKKFKPLNNEDDAFEFYSTRPISYDMFSPLYRWTRKWTCEELEKALKSTLVVQSKTGFVKPRLEISDDFGKIKEIKVIKRAESGKIVTMQVVTDKNTFVIEKELVIRRAFTKDGKALPGANVVFKTETDKDGNIVNITAYGGGFGHGCGMSQYGAMYMAQKCRMGFDVILKHYYNGICLGTNPIELKDKYISQCFYCPTKKAVLVIVDKFDAKVLQLMINEEVVNLDLEKASRKKRCEIDLSEYMNKSQLNTIIFTPPCQNRLDTRRMEKVKPMRMYVKLL